VCRFHVAAGGRHADKQLSGAVVRSVTKLASITFLSLAFSYWVDYLSFITEGKLAAVLITPSLGGSQLVGHLHHQYRTINKFSGTVAGEKEDFCKESLARIIFYFVFSFALLYFWLHLFIKNKKN
jgi:hypothetical protein